MWRLYYQLSAEGRNRYYNELLPVLHDTKQEVMGDRDDDCYYLVYIGTKPNARGKGYASRLILDMMAKVCSSFHFLPCQQSWMHCLKPLECAPWLTWRSSCCLFPTGRCREPSNLP